MILSHCSSYITFKMQILDFIRVNNKKALKESRKKNRLRLRIVKKAFWVNPICIQFIASDPNRFRLIASVASEATAWLIAVIIIIIVAVLVANSHRRSALGWRLTRFSLEAYNRRMTRTSARALCKVIKEGVYTVRYPVVMWVDTGLCALLFSYSFISA